MSYFSVEFPLKTEIFQEHILAKRFEIGRKIFNALLGLAKNRMVEYQKTTAYKELIAKYNQEILKLKQDKHLASMGV